MVHRWLEAREVRELVVEPLQVIRSASRLQRGLEWVLVAHWVLVARLVEPREPVGPWVARREEWLGHHLVWRERCSI